MVRLTDLHEAEAKHMRARADAMQPVDPAPWITPKSLRECHVAIVSTAGLHRRSDAPFNPGAVDYRLLPGDVDFAAGFEDTGRNVGAGALVRHHHVGVIGPVESFVRTKNKF